MEGALYHIHCAEHMAVVVARLQVLSDVGKCAQVLGVLGCTRDVPDLVLGDDVLHQKGEQIITPWLRDQIIYT